MIALQPSTIARLEWNPSSRVVSRGVVYFDVARMMRPARRSRSSTSTTNAPSNATSARSTSSKPERTSCSSGPGAGKTHLAIGLSIRACQADHPCSSPPPPNGSTASPSPLATAGATMSYDAPAATRSSSSTKSATSPSMVKLPICSSSSSQARYERASVIVTSNTPFGRWVETFGDATVAAAMIDRLVHHAEVVTMKGDSTDSKIATADPGTAWTISSTRPSSGWTAGTTADSSSRSATSHRGKEANYYRHNSPAQDAGLNDRASNEPGAVHYALRPTPRALGHATLERAA